MQAFLTLLYRFVLALQSPDAFVDALDVWSIFAVYVRDNRLSVPRQEMYTQGLVQLSGNILEKMLFKTSSDLLGMLDDVERTGRSGIKSGQDSDEFGDEVQEFDIYSIVGGGSNTSHMATETELDLYMKRCFDVIRNITEIKEATTRLFNAILPLLSEGLSNFNACANNSSSELSRQMRDLATVLDVRAPLAIIFQHRKMSGGVWSNHCFKSATSARRSASTLRATSCAECTCLHFVA